MNKHTKGPWMTEGPRKGWGNNIAILDSSGKCVVYQYNSPEWRVRARLIAAAPDMLEVLKRNYRDMDQIDALCKIAGVHPFTQMQEEIKQAIERATGQSIEEVADGKN